MKLVSSKLRQFFADLFSPLRTERLLPASWTKLAVGSGMVAVGFMALSSPSVIGLAAYAAIGSACLGAVVGAFGVVGLAGYGIYRFASTHGRLF